MSFQIKYKPLFKVNILHKYYLNKGTEEYFSMNSVEKEKQLAGYNITEFITVFPSAKCIHKLNGSNLIFKASNSGFMVFSRVSDLDDTVPYLSLKNELELTFLLKLTNITFVHFTKSVFHLPVSSFSFQTDV